MAPYIVRPDKSTNRAAKSDRDRASQWQALSISELEDKASQLYSEVERWEKLAEAKHPDLWDEYKLNSFNVQLKLNFAYSGSFYVAMRDFALFLSRVGASFEELRLH